MCLCGDARPVPTRTGLLILQHPRERLHPFGTARLARLALPQARIEVPYNGWDESLRCEVSVPKDAAILFPHCDAIDLEDLPAGERPSLLVVLDGTWSHARKLYRDNPWLQQLRHVRLHPRAPSNYRIRKEPQADFVSTIEAIVQALRILEPDNDGLDSLLQLFDRMIDRQIAHLDVVPRHGRARRPRQRASKRLSPVLDDPRLIVAYAETTMPDGDPARARELVQWAAVRLADGAVFDVLLRPQGFAPTDDHLRHMRLDLAALHTGVDVAAALAAFSAFAGDGAPIAAWTRTTLEWGRAFVAGRADAVLKTDYCNLRNHRSSYLETVVAKEGLQAPVVGCRGRAADRLANAVAVARWLAAERAMLRVR